MFKVQEHNPKFVLGVLCNHSGKFFLRLHFHCRHTFASLRAYVYILPHLDKLVHVVILLRNAHGEFSGKIYTKVINTSKFEMQGFFSPYSGRVSYAQV